MTRIEGQDDQAVERPYSPNVRILKIEHIDKLLALDTLIWQREYKAERIPAGDYIAEERRVLWERTLSNSNKTVFGIFSVKEEPIGYAVANRELELIKDYLTASLGVHPNYRCMGVARKLGERIIKHAREDEYNSRQYQGIACRAYKDSDSLQMLLHWGFEAVGEEEKDRFTLHLLKLSLDHDSLERFEENL